MDILAKLLGYVMYGCSWLVGNNYVLGLLLFALAMQILLSPFGIKQQKNLIKQASLRPREMAIRKKYAGRTDRVTMQKMQNEIMQLQQDAGYSPLAGCLPMLLQVLLVFPIYQVAVRPLEFIVGLSKDVCNTLVTFVQGLGVKIEGASAQVQLASWLHDSGNISKIPADLMAGEGEGAVNVLEAVNSLEFIPDVTLFGTDLGMTPYDSLGTSAWWLVLIPLLNLGFMYLSQFLSRKLQYQSTLQEDAQNNPMASMKIMMLVMPLMSMFITFSFASAIGIYWIFRTLLSMLQQFILYKAMPYPTFTEEDYKNAEKELKGKRVSKSAPDGYVPSDKPIRSLHHIDDEDE